MSENLKPTAAVASICSFRWFAISQVWAFAFALPELIYVTQATNRYFLHWSFTEWLVRFTGVGLLGIAIFLIGLIVRTARPHIVHGFGVILGGLSLAFLAGRGAFVLYQNNPETLVRILPFCLVVVAIGLTVAIRARAGFEKLSRWLSTMCAVCFPVLLIYWGNLLFVPSFDSAGESELPGLQVTQVAFDQEQSHNVYIFILDGWPERLTMMHGQVNPALENLHELSQKSCVFTDAHAPGCHTFVSLPRLLFQRADRYSLRGEQVGFTETEFVPCKNIHSLFDVARSRGFQTYLVGWYHPYQQLLGGKVDFIKSIPYYSELGPDFQQRLFAFYWRWVGKLLGNDVARATIGDEEIMRNYALANQTYESVKYTTAVLKQKRNGQFAVFHLPVPHWPFCMDRDGPKELNQAYPRDSDQLALEQLMFTDELMGDFLQLLKANGKFENSTIVVTSDHNWRTDPELDLTDPAQVSHVPTLIKYAHQSDSIVVRENFSTHFLAEILFASSDQQQQQQLGQLLKEKNLYTPLDAAELDAKYLLKLATQETVQQ